MNISLRKYNLFLSRFSRNMYIAVCIVIPIVLSVAALAFTDHHYIIVFSFLALFTLLITDILAYFSSFPHLFDRHFILYETIQGAPNGYYYLSKNIIFNTLIRTVYFCFTAVYPVLLNAIFVTDWSVSDVFIHIHYVAVITILDIISCLIIIRLRTMLFTEVFTYLSIFILIFIACYLSFNFQPHETFDISKTAVIILCIVLLFVYTLNICYFVLQLRKLKRRCYRDAEENT